MEPNQTRALNWKTCFKSILAPHLLNSSDSEEQNYENDPCNNAVNSENDCRSPDDKLPDSKIPLKSEDDLCTIDAEQLAKNFTAWKCTKNKYCNMAESSRSAPDWNTAFKKVLNRPSMPENSMETNEEFRSKEPHSLCSKISDSSHFNPWSFHRLGGDDFEESDQKEVGTKSCSKNCVKKNRTQVEQNAFHVLQLAKSFRPSNYKTRNHIHGPCDLKDSDIQVPTECSSSKTDEPKNVPPAGGWVTVKRFTIEDTLNSPPNIVSELWDNSDDEW